MEEKGTQPQYNQLAIFPAKVITGLNSQNPDSPARVTLDFHQPRATGTVKLVLGAQADQVRLANGSEVLVAVLQPVETPDVAAAKAEVDEATGSGDPSRDLTPSEPNPAPPKPADLDDTVGQPTTGHTAPSIQSAA